MILTRGVDLMKFEERKRKRESRICWDFIIQIEPFFEDLLCEIEQIRAGDSFCANEIWYERYKPIVMHRVGWYAPRYAPEILRTSVAYEIVYQKLYDALPNCRKCACNAFSEAFGLSESEA